MSRRASVTTGSRLHFGLLSFGHTDRRQYGGTGLLVDEPATSVVACPSDAWSASGPSSERALAVARRVVEQLSSRGETASPFQIDIASAPPEHGGLGSGTQLSLAVTAAVLAAHGRDVRGLTVEDWARWSGRGARSAIGLHGFVHGGLILEGGKLPDEPASPLVARCAWPEDWPILLVRGRGPIGLSGSDEGQAFAALPPVPQRVSAELCRLAVMQIWPSVASRDFMAATDAIHLYGQLAGGCFHAAQGDTYASPEIRRVAETMTALGIGGVGQSSWGPTVFGFLASREEAPPIKAALRRRLADLDPDIQIVSARNAPFTLETSDVP
jgi:beta-RFAP synthase